MYNMINDRILFISTGTNSFHTWSTRSTYIPWTVTRSVQGLLHVCWKELVERPMGVHTLRRGNIRSVCGIFNCTGWKIHGSLHIGGKEAESTVKIRIFLKVRLCPVLVSSKLFCPARHECLASDFNLNAPI